MIVKRATAFFLSVCLQRFFNQLMRPWTKSILSFSPNPYCHSHRIYIFNSWRLINPSALKLSVSSLHPSIYLSFLSLPPAPPARVANLSSVHSVTMTGKHWQPTAQVKGKTKRRVFYEQQPDGVCFCCSTNSLTLNLGSFGRLVFFIFKSL